MCGCCFLFQTQFSSGIFCLHFQGGGFKDFWFSLWRAKIAPTDYSIFFKRLNGNLVFLPSLRRNPWLRRTKHSGSGWSLPTSLCWSGALHLRPLDCFFAQVHCVLIGTQPCFAPIHQSRFFDWQIFTVYFGHWGVYLPILASKMFHQMSWKRKVGEDQIAHLVALLYLVSIT